MDFKELDRVVEAVAHVKISTRVKDRQCNAHVRAWKNWHSNTRARERRIKQEEYDRLKVLMYPHLTPHK